jgi:CRP-like cAMP-binding protein
MVSIELLRRYPFFGFLNYQQLNKVAMISEEVSVDKGNIIFQMGETADAFYLLAEGSIDLHHEVIDELFRPDNWKDFLIGEVNPGECFGISTVTPPYDLMASAQATSDCQAIRVDGEELRNLMETDSDLASGFLLQIILALKERLQYTRIQLAAARA